MIDHTGVIVSDFARSRAFYSQALAPIGHALLAQIPAAVTQSTDVACFGGDAFVLDPDGHNIEAVCHEPV